MLFRILLSLLLALSLSQAPAYATGRCTIRFGTFCLFCGHDHQDEAHLNKPTKPAAQHGHEEPGPEEHKLADQIATAGHGEKRVELGPMGVPMCLNCTYLELPRIVPLARAAIERNGIKDPHIVAGDAEKMPWKDGELGLVVAKNFAFHGRGKAVEDRIDKVLGQINRVLKPGGEAFLLMDTNGLVGVYGDPTDPTAITYNRPGTRKEVLEDDFGYHMKKAKELGFKITPIYTEHLVGIHLTKPADK